MPDRNAGPAGTGENTMRQALLIVDVQRTFSPPEWLVEGVRALARTMASVAVVEHHDEAITPFQRQLGWHPSTADPSLVEADRVVVKYGYLPPAAAIDHLRALYLDRVLVCGLQTECCVLAAGFALFDAGLNPYLVEDLTVGSSLDRSGNLGSSLWRHHFRNTVFARDIMSGPVRAADE